MSNPVDPQTGDPEGHGDQAEGDEPTEAQQPSERADTAGIVVEVEEEEGEPDPVAALEARLAEAESTAQQNHDRMMRAAADLDNFRKRSRREVADARTEGQTAVLREILPVVDNLERAVAATESATDTSGIREGVELVLRQFIQTLEKLSVVKVEARGMPFDPNVHEAVSQMATADHPPGTVVEVLQPGYKLGDRLLRAALCVVATAPPPPAPPEPEPEPEPEAGEPEIEISETDGSS